MKTVQDYATDIVSRLVNAGYTAYFAGGWVRDYLMKHPSSDIDIATDAPPEKILELFPRTILVGVAFGVVIVVMGGHQFEVATFRKDLRYVNGRTPEGWEFSTAREDAMRRDFTINGMFYDPLEHVVHDFVEGVHDINLGIIRAIGVPYERFVEDRLRMIRAVRFSSRFGFAIDPETQEAIAQNAPTLFPAVAKERVWQEFGKMSEFPHMDHAIIELHRLNLLSVIFPQLENTHLTDIKRFVSDFPHFPAGTPTILYIQELFPSLSLEQKMEIFLDLRVSNEELRLLEASHHLRELLEQNPVDLSDWVRFYAKPYADLLLAIQAAHLPEEEREPFLFEHRERKEFLIHHVNRMVINKPLVTGLHLKSEGIVPGKEMGRLLKEAEKLAINENLTDAAMVIHRLKQTPNWINE